jgi:CheY-like chemotaxis protein
MMTEGSPWVLIVEDDDDASGILVDLLARAGVHAITASNGAEAIDMLERCADRPAAIITDMLMPGVIGTSLLEYLRGNARLAAIPVAVMTSAPHLVPDGYLLFKKPFEVSAVIRFLFGHCAAQQGDAAALSRPVR